MTKISGQCIRIYESGCMRWYIQQINTRCATYWAVMDSRDKSCESIEVSLDDALDTVHELCGLR